MNDTISGTLPSPTTNRFIVHSSSRLPLLYREISSTSSFCGTRIRVDSFWYPPPPFVFYRGPFKLLTIRSLTGTSKLCHSYSNVINTETLVLSHHAFLDWFPRPSPMILIVTGELPWSSWSVTPSLLKDGYRYPHSVPHAQSFVSVVESEFIIFPSVTGLTLILHIQY